MIRSSRSTTILLEFRNKSALEEAEEPGPEPEPEPKVRAVTVLRLAKGLGLTGALIRVSENTDWKEQRAATTERGIGLRCLISSSLLQALVHRHLYCWMVEMVIHLTGLQCKG
jgi:hypothetical protein